MIALESGDEVVVFAGALDRAQVEIPVPDVRIGDDREIDAGLLLAGEDRVQVEHLRGEPPGRLPRGREQMTVDVNNHDGGTRTVSTGVESAASDLMLQSRPWPAGNCHRD